MSEAFSDGWAQAWGRALNESPEYRSAAATGEGRLAAAARTEAGNGPAVYLDVWHGECRAARAATADDLRDATYLLEAAPAVWREVFEGRLAPVMALMTGRVRLARGELAKLLPYSAAAKELIRLASGIETVYPADW